MTSSSDQSTDPGATQEKAEEAYKSSLYEEAADLFITAADLYDALNDRLSAAEARSNACVAYLQAKNVSRALDVIVDVPDIFAAEGDLKRQGISLGNYASALDADGQSEAAIEKYLEAAELLETTNEADFQSHIYRSLSHLENKRGNQLQSTFYYRRYLLKAKNLGVKEKLLKQLFRLFM
jgi:tetratricopeptide (TPR) repeat protein